MALVNVPNLELYGQAHFLWEAIVGHLAGYLSASRKCKALTSGDRLGKTIAKGEDGRYCIAGSRRRVPTPM